MQAIFLIRTCILSNITTNKIFLLKKESLHVPVCLVNCSPNKTVVLICFILMLYIYALYPLKCILWCYDYALVALSSQMFIMMLRLCTCCSVSSNVYYDVMIMHLLLCLLKLLFWCDTVKPVLTEPWINQ